MCGPGGGGSICSLGYCLPDGSCPPSPGPGDTGWRLLRRVYKPESASTPLCHYTRTRLLFMEKSVRTRPPRGDRDYCVPGPRQHTPHSCARGWTFKTFPLTPPGAAPGARLASLGDAEPCCHPFLRTLRFSGTRCVACGSGSGTPKMPLANHAYQRWAQRCVCEPCSSSPHPRGLSILSTRPRISSQSRPHTVAGPQTGAHRLPRSPAPRARAGQGCALPSVCLAPRKG